MVLSQTAEYALRAVLYLAGPGAGRAATAAEIAEAVGVPRSYLSKTLQVLVRGGIVVSVRGRSGGFALGVPADTLMLHSVVALFETSRENRRCLLGRAQCSDRTACAAHHAWKSTAERITRFFGTTSVGQLARV